MSPDHRLRFTWHLRRWRAATPGGTGLVLIALATLLMASPLHRVSEGGDWSQAIGLAMTVGAMLLGLLLAHDVALPDAAEHWLYLQGGSPTAWGLERLAAMQALTIVVALAWCAAAMLGGRLWAGAPAPVDLATAAVLIWCIASVVQALCFALSATGNANAVGIAVITLLFAAMAPGFAAKSGPVLAWALTHLPPPIVKAAEFRQALRLTAWREALTLGLGLATWSAAMLAAGAWLLDRRVPRPPR